MIAHSTSDRSLKPSTPWIYELIAREVHADDDEWQTMLRHKYYKRRGPRKGSGGVHQIPRRVDIDQRATDVDTRETFGHWEGDTIIGGGHQGAFETLVARRAAHEVPRRLTLNQTCDGEGHHRHDATVRRHGPYHHVR